MLPGRRGDLQHLNSLSAPRILLIRPDRLGDAIISTPVIRLLRERFPNASLSMLLGRKNASAAAILPDLDDAIVLPDSLGRIIGTIRRLRRNRYDLAINLLAKDSASGSLLTALAGASFTIGFAGASASIYTAIIEKPAGHSHIVRETSLLLGPLAVEPIGEHPGRDAERLRIVLPEPLKARARALLEKSLGDMPRPIVVLNISGSGPEKFLGIERYIEVGQRIIRAGLTPVFAASPADRHALGEIAGRCGALMLPITQSFAEFAALLECADMIVTPDTSIVHIAAALGKPTVALVPAATTGTGWGPWGVPCALLSGHGSVADIAADAVAHSIISLASNIAGLAPLSSAS